MSNWQKVTRWAGIGNNGRDAAKVDGSNQMMADETKVVTEDQTHGDVEVMDAPAETGPSEVELLKAEKDQLIDRLARLQAEFDNARKREAKERADAREYTIGSTVEPFLGVMDNFQLALKADGTVEQLRAGVSLILKQMEEALKGLQVVPVETIGTQFDPRVHEALGSVETAEFPDHQVVEEIRRGYKIRERLLRPAMVRIAVNPAQVDGQA
jgi:molecular chaperone GrpE